MLRVIDVDYIRNYELLVTFSDGSKKIVNLEPYLTGEVFGELLDKEKFVQYGLTRATIEWANGADLAPEFLYEIGIAAYLDPMNDCLAIQDKKEETFLYRIFISHPELNASAVARRMGISQSLMSQYISGIKKPSQEREALIVNTIKDIGKELTMIV